MKRVVGLLLIVRALAPLIAVATLLWAVNQVGDSFQASVGEPLAGLKTELDDLGQTIRTAWQQFEAASGSIGVLASRLHSFTLPTLNPGQLDALVGGIVGPINNLFRGLENVFRPFGDLLSDVGGLGSSLRAIPQSFASIAGQGERMLNRLRGVVDRWSGLLIVAVVLILMLVAIYNVTPIVDDLRRGWGMLK